MHKVIVAKIDRVVPIEGAETVQQGFVLGEQVVISKDWKEGDIGIFFPIDVQISEEYCHVNNLYRDSAKNKNIEKKGFFEDSRRVRAQTFLKVRSCGLFMPLDSLSYTGNCVWEIGQTFDEINGVKICQKYISEQTRRKIANGSTKPTKQSLYPTFAKHVDSEQFKHFVSSIRPGSLLSFHAKIHGTSFRVGKVKKIITLNWKQKLLNLLGAKIPDYVYDYVVGTRNVIIENESKEGFHGSEAFRFEVMEQIKPFLQDGMVVYGEIAGYANGKPIMPNGDIKALKDKRYTDKYGNTNVFSYGCKEHEYRFHIYRITREAVNGDIIDMSAKELEAWCEQRGLLGTFEISPQQVYNGDEEKLRSLVEELTERPSVLTSDYINPVQIGEGIIIRVDYDGVAPKFFKNKSYAFKVLEGMIETEDIETMS